MAEKAKCRVCGAEFNPCNGIAGIPPEQQPFNWRKICCSVACGSKFITSVLESRGLTNEGTPVEAAAPAPPSAPKPKRRKPAVKPAAEPKQPVEPAEDDTEPVAEETE